MSYLANANGDFRLLVAFRDGDGVVHFAQLPIFGFTVREGIAADVVSVDTAEDDEVKAIIDLRTGCWWDGPFACGETLESCREYLAGLFDQMMPAADVPHVDARAA